MEAGTVLTDSHRIFCHLPVQQLVCTAVFIVDCIKAACSDTASAALTFVVIDNRFSIQICNRIASALLCTASAAAAFFQIDSRLSAGMLLHLACTAAAAHADIFDGTAKSGRFMSLKVRQADKNIRIHNCTSDLRCRTILCIRNRYFYLVRTPQTVSDQNLTACCDGIKAV